MRRIRLLVLVMMMTLAGIASPASAAPENFTTHLTGAEEVPAVDTDAQGQAIFQVDDDGDAISYRLNVANISDVLMAHLHLGEAGANGGIVVWLYPDGPPPQLIPGRTQGTLATGTITADDLVGDLAGAGLDALIEAMRAGEIYVNVHTLSSPGGEIRGQID
ncbi:MAG TPA: CHRD domain-containing protein [Euzebyales bacterium]